MNTPAPRVCLLDVDNTLLDNDRFYADLCSRLQRDFGNDGRDAYLAIYETRRDKLGYADYLGALQIFGRDRRRQPALLQLSSFLLDYPFTERLYPQALAAISHLRSRSPTVLLSDGDLVFQPRKIQRSGLWDAVAGQVLIELHKEQSLAEVQHRFPAAHYLMVDDKPDLLAAMKRALGTTLTTVFVRQGHYAQVAPPIPIEPAPDRVIERIGELITLDVVLHPEPA